MAELIPVVTHRQISKRIADVGEQISKDYAGKNPVLIGVLKGAFIFLADLVRHLTMPYEVDFVRAASYGMETKSSGTVQLLKDVEVNLKDRDVIVVEDIVDSGLTLAYLIDHLSNAGASSVKICTLVDKTERREAALTIDYACHHVEKGFLVGYGLDYQEQYRGLPAIFHLKQ